MSCIAEGNTRCTKCCEAIHIEKRSYISLVKGRITVGRDNDLLALWKPISKRRAKKINPYIFDPSGRTKQHLSWANQDAQFFTCTALVKGVGCSVRGTDKHPETCKIYVGELSDYSPTCPTDINIIARSTQ
jgi:hypothetical protein